jgi:hypothetical protein
LPMRTNKKKTKPNFRKTVMRFGPSVMPPEQEHKRTVDVRSVSDDSNQVPE